MGQPPEKEEGVPTSQEMIELLGRAELHLRINKRCQHRLLHEDITHMLERFNAIDCPPSARGQPSLETHEGTGRPPVDA
jgi:23S rRNA A1618 N6-methylase RlmF